MATRLKDTDVVIVGLGAAGGVAALPLAQAGLEVIGLEAGSWLTRHDFAPDELRNNYRGLAPGRSEGRTRRFPTSRANASSPTGPRGNIHPMQNGVGGTTLHYWAQSWRLNPWDFKVVSETKRRYGASRIPQGSTVEDWPFGLDELETVLRQGRVRDRRIGPGWQHRRQDRRARQPVRRRAQARVPDARRSARPSSSRR
jgi:gluconate 2-dehydrogenase alpha chain